MRPTGFESLVSLLRDRAERRPEKRVYTFLDDGERPGASVTYAELDHRARGIAARLQERGLDGERALLLYPQGLEFMAAFFGCLYAGVTAIPAYPPDPRRLQRSLRRLDQIVDDATPAVVLTTGELDRAAGALLDGAAGSRLPSRVASDGVATLEAADDWRDPGVAGDTLAFLQYTSGSTGLPKGVMVTHGNLLANLDSLSQVSQTAPETDMLSWLPLYHDMGLIGAALHAVAVGCECVLMDPVSFIQRPSRWLQAITRYRPWFSGGPNFGYELCLRKIADDELAGFDLGSWSVAFNGAEPVRASTIERFAARFARCGLPACALRPCYGLAEATLMVSFTPRRTAGFVSSHHFDVEALHRGAVRLRDDVTDGRRLVGCGPPADGWEVLIVDPETLAPASSGAIGEIWARGPSVAAGYWKRDEESRAVFHALPASTALGERGYLRTGDLGFLCDGEIVVAGRIKDLIVVRGLNHHPQDIEELVEGPGIRPGSVAAFSIDDGGEERLVLVAEADRVPSGDAAGPAVEALGARCARAVAEGASIELHRLVLIEPGTLPKTSSGKVQRSQIRRDFLEGKLRQLATVAPRPAPAPAPVGESAPIDRAVAARSRHAIERWLRQRLAQRLGVEAEAVDRTRPFAEYGIDSQEGVAISGELAALLRRPLPATSLWDHPTIAALAAHLAADAPSIVAETTRAIAAPTLPSTETPIAIVGIGCRFPGAAGPESLWSLLREGRHAITAAPADRFAESMGPLRRGGFLEDVAGFDHEFFGISRREAVRIDPQQRLLLEVSWEALEDAGFVPQRLQGSATGVYVGISSYDYGRLQLAASEELDAYSNTGSALSIAANRVSYLFDWRGPSVAVDTACSASLVAVHLACEALRRGECELALAGGVNLILTPAVTRGFSLMGVMAADGRCKAFGAGADGYVRSEGAGVVVLKRLDRAVADGDRVYAVVLGSAVNQDGRSNGLTAPSGEAQETVLAAAWRRAGVAPDAIQYVEAHGSGTALGDRIEAAALARALARDGDQKRRCALGSIKSNLGHLEAAAGVAGLIKVALSLRRRELPPTLHVEVPNPEIDFAATPLALQERLSPWPDPAAPLVAGVSSFGFGGTNAHVVVAEPPRTSAPRGRPEPTNVPASGVFTLSAKSEPALDAVLASYARHVAEPAADDESWLRDLIFTTNVRRSHHRFRVAVVARGREQLLSRLEEARTSSGGAFARGDAGLDRAAVAFVFPGQGSQWSGMGRGLLAAEPVFRDALERCDRAFRGHVDWSLLDVLGRDGALTGIGRVQPALFAIQLGLAELLRSWGVEPAAVVGQSMGEVAAACVAGALDLDTAAGVICRRSRLLRASGGGAMAVIGLGAEAARAAIGARAAAVTVAVEAGPRSTVIAGEARAVEEVLRELEPRGVFCRRVEVDVASHSPLMDPLLDALRGELDGLRASPGSVPLYSTVRGAPIDGAEMSAEYWVENLRRPVRLASAVERLRADGVAVLLEVSPHPTLLPMLSEILGGCGGGAVVSTLRREADERESLLLALASLHVHGVDVAWDRLHPAGGAVVSTPAYPWQRRRCWLAPAASDRPRPGTGSHHPFLGSPERSLLEPDRWAFRGEVAAGACPELLDHRVDGTAVLPAVAFVELAARAAQAALGPGAIALHDLEIHRALAVAEQGTTEIETIVRSEPRGAVSVRIASAGPADGRRVGDAVLHASARATLAADPPRRVDGTAVGRATRFEPAELYRALRRRGLDYGPSFRAVEELEVGGGEVLASLRASGDGALGATSRIDGGLQALAALASAAESDSEILVPAMIERALVEPSALASLRQVRARLERGADGRLRADLVYGDAEGRSVLELHGVVLAPVVALGVRSEPTRIHDLGWEPVEPVAALPATSAGGAARWLVLADRGVGPALRPRLGECVLVRPGAQWRRLGPDFEIDPTSPADWTRLLDALHDGPAITGVVHLWSFDSPEPEKREDFEHLLTLTTGGVLHLVQALARAAPAPPPRLWLVTPGTAAVEGSAPAVVAPALLVGLGRTLLHEHPELHPVVLDLEPGGADDTASRLAEVLRAGGDEEWLAVRGGRVRAARLEARAGIEAERSPWERAAARLGAVRARAATGRAAAPAAGQVRIRATFVGLNFLDVLTALDGRPDGGELPSGIGAECCGAIEAVGAGVDGFAPGERVVAIAPDVLGGGVLARAELVRHAPSGWSPAEAATLPIAFFTARYALEHLARLEPGETVLVHAAAGGVGLAAVQYARRAGARVLATAGSPEKRAYLASLGVESAMDSRSLDFAREVLDRTGGRGVDVVLNSLAGEAMERSLDVVAPFGRFVEIGKRDLAQNRAVGLRSFRRNISFCAFDLAALCQERPAVAGAWLARVVEDAAQQRIEPLPLRTYRAGQIEDALRCMARAEHVGKLVIDLEPALDAATSGDRDADAAYLVTGGLGALGLEAASSLVRRGARKLVLVSRGGVGPEQRAAIEELEALGARVTTERADVCDREALAAVLAGVARSGARLAGVVHAAGVLDDGLFDGQTSERFRAVLAPKVQGAWNLHRLTESAPLELFVLFSSAAGVLGSPAQSSYAAANTFLDALAAHRRARGLPGLSIAWGPWAKAGLATRSGGDRRLALRGVGALDPAEGKRLLDRLLTPGGPAPGSGTAAFSAGGALAVVLALDAAELRATQPALARSRFLSRLGTGPVPGARPALVEALLREPRFEARRALLETHVKERLAAVTASDVRALDVRQPLGSVGIDSLLGLELRNRLGADLGLELPATLVFAHPTVEALVSHLDTLLAKSVRAAAHDGAAVPMQRAAAVGAAQVRLDGGEAPAELSIADQPSIELAPLLEEVSRLSEEEALHRLRSGRDRLRR